MLGLAAARAQTPSHSAHGTAAPAAPSASRAFPGLPSNLPGWLFNRQANHVFPRRGPYNFAVYNLRPLALDLNGVAVGHALAYEDLVTGKAARLETATYAQIRRVLQNPPRLMPDERAISPTFARNFGVLEQVFDATHVLHAQTVDVLASPSLSPGEKDREIERLYRYYQTRVPYAITGLPMNMAYLDSQPYSGTFRKKYPKVNGLFWGYHWLQGAMYDLLDNKTPAEQKRAYEVLGKRYRETELLRTDRAFMPMFAEISPNFAAKHPALANVFDNLHMLHDLANDVLATDGLSDKQKQEQVTRAIWLVMAAAHANEKPGDAKVAGGLHDHRFSAGMPGMGLMKGATQDVMYMPGMNAWMRMDACAHCSMPLAPDQIAGRAPTVSADGWTMRVRCALCARDMAAQTQGDALLSIPTEDPRRWLTVLSDAQGRLTTDLPGAVFLEQEGSHAGCNDWSRAFSSRAAFDAYMRANPQYKNARALSLSEWQEREGKKPDTYVKTEGPVENPYANGGAGEAKP